jgi:hypothetical protein
MKENPTNPFDQGIISQDSNNEKNSNLSRLQNILIKAVPFILSFLTVSVFENNVPVQAQPQISYSNLKADNIFVSRQDLTPKSAKYLNSHDQKPYINLCTFNNDVQGYIKLLLQLKNPNHTTWCEHSIKQNPADWKNNSSLLLKKNGKIVTMVEYGKTKVYLDALNPDAQQYLLSKITLQMTLNPYSDSLLLDDHFFVAPPEFSNDAKYKKAINDLLVKISKICHNAGKKLEISPIFDHPDSVLDLNYLISKKAIDGLSYQLYSDNLEDLKQELSKLPKINLPTTIILYLKTNGKLNDPKKIQEMLQYLKSNRYKTAIFSIREINKFG